MAGKGKAEGCASCAKWCLIIFNILFCVSFMVIYFMLCFCDRNVKCECAKQWSGVRFDLAFTQIVRK